MYPPADAPLQKSLLVGALEESLLHRSRSWMRLRTVLKIILLVLALPCVYFGGASGAFFYRHHALNAASALAELPQEPAPTQHTRLMVFAPHCDDETLGCGGLIQQTLAQGGSARVVLLTNGDGFRTAVEHEIRSVRVGPGDYVRFAALRQEESYHALTALGLSRADVSFLGYPDQGLQPLWNSYWNPDHTYTSNYTHCDRSPYGITFDPNAVYCGRDLLADVKATLRAFRPTLVTVTHPGEDHPDHAAAAAFVTRAVQELQTDPRQAPWAKDIQLRYYLVHRGDWPLPQGRHLAAPLAPPAEMAYLDTHWTTRPLTPQETQRKADSIALYASQTAMMQRFLISFARRSELLGEIAPTHLATVPDHTIHVDADTRDWEALPPALLDPVRDNVLRDLQGGGDIQALYACRDSQNLYLRLDTRQTLSNRILYQLAVRPFGPHGETPAAAYTVPVRTGDTGAVFSNGIQVATRGRILEVAIPWRNLTHGMHGSDVKTLAISADTILAGVPIDKTGVRFLNL